MNNLNFDDFNWSLASFISFECFVGLMVVTTNLLIMIAMAKSCSRVRLRRKRVHDLILSLCVADLLVGFVTIPINILLKIGMFDADKRVCITMLSLAQAPHLASMFGLVSISIERYKSVVDPYANSTQVFTRILIISTWIISGLISILPLISGYLVNGRETAETGLFECSYSASLPRWYICVLSAVWMVSLCCIMLFYWKMTRAALQAQAKSRRNSIHSNIFDGHIANYSNAKRSLSMPDVYSGLNIKTGMEIKSIDAICQQHELNRKVNYDPESEGSSRETISSGLKTNSSASSIGSSRVEGTISSVSMQNLSPAPKRITKLTNHMKSYVMMSSTKSLAFVHRLSGGKPVGIDGIGGRFSVSDRIGYVLSCLVCVFIVTHLPFYVLSITQLAADHIIDTLAIMDIFVVFVHLNSFFNPVLYSFRVKRVRTSLQNLFKRNSQSLPFQP